MTQVASFLGRFVPQVALFVGRASTVCHDLSGFVSWTTLTLYHEQYILLGEVESEEIDSMP